MLLGSLFNLFSWLVFRAYLLAQMEYFTHGYIDYTLYMSRRLNPVKKLIRISPFLYNYVSIIKKTKRNVSILRNGIIMFITVDVGLRVCANYHSR